MSKTVKELHEEREKIWNESIKNHAKYIDKDSGIFMQKYTKYRDCPVCNTDNYIEIFYKEGGRYVKCKECSMVYINPVFTDSALKEYYEQNHTEQASLVESDTDSFYTDIYNGGLDNILEYGKKTSVILDVGCSSGTFLDQCAKRDIKTYGVELNKSEYQFAKNKNHIVYNTLLEDIKFDIKFDAISMWDVFEHIKDGEYYLNLMKNLIADDGVIFLQIPSSDSLAAKILQEHCNMFDGLEHVNLYGVDTIKKLSEKCGLKVLNIKSVISEIGVINNYLNYENPYLGNTKNKKFIPNLIDEDNIHKILQGYKLQIVLGKY